MTLFGKLFHFGLDAVLITALLAGIKRNTGLTYVRIRTFRGESKCLVLDLIACRDYVFRVALEHVPNKEFRSESGWNHTVEFVESY